MDDDLSSQDGGPSIPAGVLRTSKKGWAGEELEMEHRMEHNPDKDFAVVNIKQFQNTEVGTGYQARGVVRQKTTTAASHQKLVLSVRHLPSKTVQQGTSADGKPADSRHPKDTKQKGNKRKRLDDYMSCNGIREFRKEIEQLLESASR